MDPGELPLRDIHLPDAVPWWPQTPGWWVLAGLIALLSITAWLRYRRRLNTGAVSAALAELEAAERAYKRDGDAHTIARTLSRLARRVALHYAAARAAAVTGDAWMGLLRELGGGAALGDDMQTLLLRGAYSRAVAATLDRRDCQAAIDGIGTWLSRLESRPHAATRP